MKSNLVLAAILGVFNALSPALGSESKCGPLEQEVETKDIPCLVQEVAARSFPELADALAQGRIEYSKFNSDDYFLKVSFLSGHLKSSDRRQYSIDINPKMVRTFLPVLPRPSIEAVQGILAHELVHLSDYETASFTGLVGLLKDGVLSKAKAERAADQRAFELGYARGIALYRIWLYSRLDAKALELKKKRYYTPEEIQEWIMQNELARPNHQQ